MLRHAFLLVLFVDMSISIDLSIFVSVYVTHVQRPTNACKEARYDCLKRILMLVKRPPNSYKETY